MSRRSLGYHSKVYRAFYNIKARCTNPKTNRFNVYGGRGIKSLLTLPDLQFLWERDAAALMVRPSIDRIDADGDYTLENCQWIEFDANRAKRRPLKCVRCNGIRHPHYLKRCADCLRFRNCVDCGNEFRAQGNRTICDNCRYMTRPCLGCGGSVIRDLRTGKLHGTQKSNQWFCNKICQGRWLGQRKWKKESLIFQGNERI